VLGLEMVVVVGLALLLSGLLARRFPIAPALLLVLAGVLIGFVPRLGDVQLPPEIVLLLFLPALLYWESLTTSLREIRSNLRVVVLASTGLVVATAGAVAATVRCSCSSGRRRTRPCGACRPRRPVERSASCSPPPPWSSARGGRGCTRRRTSSARSTAARRSGHAASAHVSAPSTP
jgi:hypothetical protein